MSLVSRWLMRQIAPQLRPLVMRVVALEEKLALSSTSSATVEQCRALLAQIDRTAQNKTDARK